MEEAAVFFFHQKPGALPLYRALEERILAEVEGVRVQVKKSQISFFNRHMFACASLARVRRAGELPDPYLVVTFGLDRRVDSPRIAAASEPYPNRWTHHVVIAGPEEIDGELMGWVREAAALSENKR